MLQEEGRIERLGATNFDTPHLAALLDAGVPVVAFQIQYSLLDARGAREARGAHARFHVDRPGRVLEGLAARIVRDRDEVDHRVDAAEMALIEMARVLADHLEAVVGRQQIAPEEEAIDRADVIAGFQQQRNQRGADVAARSGHQDAAHSFPNPRQAGDPGPR